MVGPHAPFGVLPGVATGGTLAVAFRVATGWSSCSTFGVATMPLSPSRGLVVLLGVRPFNAERDGSICRVQIRRRHPSRRNLLATGWPSPSCSEGITHVVAFRLFGFLFHLVLFRFLGPCLVCRRWPTDLLGGVSRRGAMWACATGLVSVTSQSYRFCGGCPASSLFARCSALEGLSRSEVVSVSWDPHPREPAGAGLACKGCGRHVSLLAASGGGLVVVVVTAFPHDTRASSGFCFGVLSIPKSRSGPGDVSRVRGGSACGPSTLWRSRWPCMRRVCGPPQLVVVALRYSALFARLTPPPLLPSARGSSSRELGVGRVAEAFVTLCVVSSSESSYLWIHGWRREFRSPGKGPGGRDVTVGIRAESTEICVHVAVGCSCCCVACMASVIDRRSCRSGAVVVDSPAVVLLYGGRLQASPGAVLLVAFGAFGSWHWLVVDSSEVLLEFFSVGSAGSEDCSALVSAVAMLPQGLRCATSVGLASAFWRVFPERCLGGSGGGCPRIGSSQDRPLSLLAEVLPRSALCLFQATVVLPLWFEVFHLVGLHSGESPFDRPWLGPAWPVVPFQHRVLVLERFGLCRLEPGCIVLYLGWLLVLVVAPCVVPCSLMGVGMLVPALSPVCVWRVCCQLFIGSPLCVALVSLEADGGVSCRFVCVPRCGVCDTQFLWFRVRLVSLLDREE
ncbi:hypothetical protein Taro_032928, partial [Colocasia esculenta]|nr:hypothetical protein [Colocasia esculenta]